VSWRRSPRKRCIVGRENQLRSRSHLMPPRLDVPAAASGSQSGVQQGPEWRRAPRDRDAWQRTGAGGMIRHGRWPLAERRRG
jgi:hypothetical protein